MRLYRHLEIFIIVEILQLSLLFGRSTDDVSHERNKRSASCSSVDSLKKYMYTTEHTACLTPSASADLSTSGVSSSDIADIVNSHNTYRAGTTATDMLKMSWDDEIAYIAQKWAENCVTNHDNGFKRRIPGKRGSYKAGRLTLGQNLAWGGNKMTWSRVVQLWYDEVTAFTYDSNNNVLADVGHYTQVVWAKTNKIGCGYVYCQNEKRHMFACNYGPTGNFNIKTPYTQGTKCQDCPGNCVNNLCDCNKVCLNGGNLDLSTCTCNCLAGYTGSDCALDCDLTSDRGTCTQRREADCSNFANVPAECPHLCQFCPGAGIAMTGATDGNGVLVKFDPTEGAGGGSGSSSVNQCAFYIISVLFLRFF